MMYNVDYVKIPFHLPIIYFMTAKQGLIVNHYWQPKTSIAKVTNMRSSYP